MIIKLKSLVFSAVLGLALLVGSFALGSSPVRADDTETTSASQPVETAAITPAPEESGGALVADRLETCISEGRPMESCITLALNLPEEQTQEAEEQPSAVGETTSPIEEVPLAQTGAAIVMEITPTATIALPGEVLPEQANDQDEPAYTGAVTTEASVTEVKTEETPEVESSAPQAIAPTSESSDIPADAPPAPANED